MGAQKGKDLLVKIDNGAGFVTVAGLRSLVTRFDDAANTRRMGGYAIANLLAEYALVPSWTLFARIDNAFDKRYELAADYNSARASVFAGVRYQR